MPAYNFQPRFVPLIESGAKQSTIRRRPKKGRLPEPGDRINLYVYQRTSRCRMVKAVTVSRVRPIIVNTTLEHGEYLIDEIVLDGAKMSRAGIELLARADGFDNGERLAEFFWKQYGPSLSAYLIEWGPGCRDRT